jgi:hypothetical protein
MELPANEVKMSPGYAKAVAQMAYVSALSLGARLVGEFNNQFN